MPSPYEPFPEEEAYPLSSYGIERAPEPTGRERRRQRWRWLLYGGLWGWPGLRVQWCARCGAERGFRSSPPPPAPPTSRYAALGPEPRPGPAPRSEDKPPPDSPHIYRHPRSTRRPVHWVRCVVCRTIVVDESGAYRAHFHRPGPAG